METIYTITTIRSIINNRLVGWYDNFSDAEKVVLGNYGDIYETCYTYAVISEVPSGIYQGSLNDIWYKWKKDKYVKCERPKEFEMTSGSYIG